MTENDYRDRFEYTPELLEAMADRVRDGKADGVNLYDLVDTDYDSYDYDVRTWANEYLENALWTIAGPELPGIEYRDAPEPEDVTDPADMLRAIEVALTDIENDRVEVTPAVAYVGWGGEIVAFEPTEAQFVEIGCSGPLSHTALEDHGIATHTAEEHRDWFDYEAAEFLHAHEINLEENPDDPFPPFCSPGLYCGVTNHDFVNWDYYLEDFKVWLEDHKGIRVIENRETTYTYERV